MNAGVIVLALGFVVIGAAAVALLDVLQPETHRLAVGLTGSDDRQGINTMA